MSDLEPDLKPDQKLDQPDKKLEIYNVETCDSYDLLTDIFQRLRELEEASQQVRQFWFNGEGDSSQTVYESLSNNLKICVIAKDERVALVLHTFLRTIIDDRDHDWYLNWLVDKDEFTMEEILDTLVGTNDTYGHSFNPKKEGLFAKCELRGRNGSYTNQEYIGDIDSWDLWRIGCHLGVLNITEKYPDPDKKRQTK